MQFTESEARRSAIALSKKTGARYNAYRSAFARLHQQRAVIENELGFAPEWRELPDRKASRIVTQMSGDFRDESVAPTLVEWLASRADDFVRVFSKHL